MRLYVKHCPFACPERRPILEKHLEERGFTDVVWVTDYSKHHQFVHWLHEKFNKSLHIEGISGLVKLYECILMFLEDESAGDHAIFCDDDVVFIDGAKDAINSVVNYPFINLSIGIWFNMLPRKDLILNNTWNNGGSEAVLMRRDFCEFLIKNFDMRRGMDIVFGAIIYHNNLKLYMLPLAQQTSLITRATNCNDPTSFEDWTEFFVSYTPTGISYLDLWKESGMPKEDKIQEYKQLVEDEFYKLYNQRIDIKNLNYILNRAGAILSRTEGGN
jgi:hypothetical protein